MDKVLQHPQIHPKVLQKALELQVLVWKKYGIKILFTQGVRTMQEQANLYAKGRTAPGRIVTNAKPGSSYHNYGLALDFVPIVNGKAAWNAQESFVRVGQEAEKLGFTWGGHFKTIKDKPHIEMNFGLTIAMLKAGRRPPK